jgi:hypothetical protein
MRLPELPFLLPRKVSIPVLGPLLAASAAGALHALDRAIDLVVADVVGRVDVNAVARRLDVLAVLDRLDLTDLVLSRVDLQRVVREVLTRLDAETLAEVLVLVDVDAIAARLDVDAVAQRLDVDAVLDRLDLTSTVVERVDLGAVVDAALASVDLVAISEEVIEGVDLPELIRESTGSMASDTVRGVRMHGIEADQTISNAMDRLLRHRRRPVEPAT